MEGSSAESGSEYFDCVTDRSGSSSEEVEYQLGPNLTTKEMPSKVLNGDVREKSVKDEVQRTPTIRKFRRIDSSRRKIENGEKAKTSVGGADPEVNRSQEKQMGEGLDIRGYDLRAPQIAHALRRLSMDADVELKENDKSQSMRSKVQDEVMKVLFGPPDAKTPDEEKYELVEQEEVTRGLGRSGILFRFSMWATVGFITWVLGGRRAHVGCAEFFPNVRERDPVPKVIIRRQT